MATIDFLSRLGIFIRKDFLDAETCKKLRTEGALSKRYEMAQLYRNGAEQLDETFRRTKNVELSKSTKLFVYESLMKIQPAIESHFKITLTGCEEPNLLHYREGDFFQLHRDSPDSPESSVSDNGDASIKRRQISLVIFLNDQASKSGPGSYSGGSLNFFGLIKDSRWEKYGFPLVGETGLLVAFRSSLPHEVTPVVSGERYTIVNWYF